MESKRKKSNNTFIENFSTIKDKEKKENTQKYTKVGINTYIHSKKNSRIYEKKKDKNNLSTIYETKNRQKQIKEYLCNTNNNKEDIKTMISNNNNIEKGINITETNTDNAIKNIKVNKMKTNNINKEYKQNNNTSYIKKDVYNSKPIERNKSFNFYGSQKNYQEKINNNYLLYNLNNNNKKNQRKSNLISVRSFDKHKDLGNDKLLYSEYFNIINPLKKDVSNFSFYQYNILNNNLNNYNKNHNTTNVNHTYNILTTPGKNRITKNASQVLLSFKDIKTFFAHLEILISLYLKRNFNNFKEKIKEYINQKDSKKIKNENIGCKNGPIINVNNAHCSLFCSININQDSNNNNKLFNTVFNSNNTPITKTTEAEKENIKLDKNLINDMDKNKLFFLNNECNINANKKAAKEVNKSVYIPKNKIIKFNYTIANENKIKASNIEENKELKNYKKQSSPIKQMNINLKKINVCKLNELNQLYLSQNLYKNNNNNSLNFSEINNLLNINNNTLHTKFNSNFIQIDENDNRNNTNNNLSKEKNYKLKKISSAKDGVYTKPKDNNKKKIIKEIKIQKNQSTPFKNEINYNNKTKKIRTENIITISNSFINNKNEDLINNNNLNTSKEKNMIKKIYIRRKSKNENKSDNNISKEKDDIKEKQGLSNLLSFKKKKETKKIFENNEIIIKDIKTSDKKLYINIKYIILNNNFKSSNRVYDSSTLKIENKNQVSIINNKIILSESIINNIKFPISDIFSFDNDKKGRNKTKRKKLIKNEFLNKLKKLFFKYIRKEIIQIISELKRNKRNTLLRKILVNNDKKVLKKYFWKFKLKNKVNKKNVNKNKSEKKICSIYHKINYNDDFNLNKRMKSPNDKEKIDNMNCKAKIYNLTTQNSILQNKTKNRIKNKRRELSSSINLNKTLKYINKEINIIVHNNTKI